MLYENFSAYGDSLTTGARCVLGWPEYLARELRERTGRALIAYNEAINGETALQLLRRMDQRNKVHTESSFSSVLIGTNDSKPIISTSPDIYEEVYVQILERLVVRRQTIICITIPRLVEPICSPYAKTSNELIKKYNEKVVALAEEFKTLLVDLSDLKDEHFSDGVHFTDSGGLEVAKKVADAVLSR